MPVDVSNFVIPEEQFQGLYQAANTLERRNEREADKKERQAQQNKLHNLSYINNATDFDQYKTGQEALDAYSQKQLGKIFENAVGNYASLDPAEMQIRLKRDMDNFVKWDTIAKAKAKQTQDQLTEFNKTVPNADLNAAHNMAFSNLANDFIDPTTGEPKPPEMIDLNKDYVKPLYEAPTLGKIVNNTKPFYDFLQTLPKTPTGDKETVDNQGRVIKNAWSGFATPHSEKVMDGKGNVIGFQLKKGAPDVVLKDKTLSTPSDEFLQEVQSNPQVAGSAYALWEQYKSKNGIKTDAATDPILYKDFLYKTANNLIPHDIKTEQVEKTPKPPRITVNVGRLGEEAKINDLYGRIGNKIEDNLSKGFTVTRFNSLSNDEQGVVTQAAKNAGFDVEEGGANLFLAKDKGQYKVYKVNDDGKLEISPKTEVTSLSFTGTNLPKQANTKGKEAVVKKANEMQQTKKIRYKANGTIYEIPENEVADFLKAFPKAIKQ